MDELFTRRQMVHLIAGGAAGLALSSSWARGATTTAPAVTRRVDEKGVIRIDGKPFFPLGMYHDSLDIDVYGETFLRDLGMIADAGFNIAHVSMDFTHDGHDAYSSTAGQAARLAQEKGMYLAMSVYVKNLGPVVAEQAKWPAILMASVGDDVNSDAKGRLTGPAKLSPARLRELTQQVKKISPNLITYSSGSAYAKASLVGYEEAVDCIGIQCYPIGDGSQSRRNELEAMEDVFANYWTLAGAKANRALIANLQSFSWDGKTWITPAEVRLQAWVALLKGARGLMWYSYLTDKAHKPLPEASPAVWEELKTLMGEIRRAQDLLVEGKVRTIANPADRSFDGGEGTWHAGLWEAGASGLVVAVNTHRTKAMEVEIDLGRDVDVTPMFDLGRYSRLLERRRTRLHGTLPPGGVDVYRLDK